MDLFYALPNTVCDDQSSVLRRSMQTHSFGREKRNKYWMWHTHTQRLPGLCHGAAVTATALRAPAQPQLLLRLAPMKVVCEFSKTRHLRSLSLRSPPLTLFAFWSVEEGKKRPVSGFVKLRGARPPGFGVRLLPGFGVIRGSEHPLVIPHSFFLVQGNKTKPCSWLFTASPCLWLVSAQHTERAHTQTHTLALSK